jgi:hypothetical protein
VDEVGEQMVLLCWADNQLARGFQFGLIPCILATELVLDRSVLKNIVVVGIVYLIVCQHEFDLELAFCVDSLQVPMEGV